VHTYRREDRDVTKVCSGRNLPTTVKPEVGGSSPLDRARKGLSLCRCHGLEVVFGQFYIAVVVAQLVGLRLAQAIKP
jgi:hypothetical protein